MRREINLALIAVVAVLAPVGCASVNDQMESWTGHHQQELILSWGPPTRTASDGADGWILIYEYDRDFGQIPGKAYARPDGSIWYTAPERSGYTASRMFWVHSDGIIYSWRWQGF